MDIRTILIPDCPVLWYRHQTPSDRLCFYLVGGDVYDRLYKLYQTALQSYQPENITFVGGSSGGNLALGLVSYIHEKGEGLPVPGKVYTRCGNFVDFGQPRATRICCVTKFASPLTK